MTIIPRPFGTFPVRTLQERAAPMYQGCFALEHENAVHIEALDPVDPSDCANVCSSFGSVYLGINAQFCTCFSTAPTITTTYDTSACSWPCDSPFDDYSCGGMESTTLDDLYSYYVAFGSTASPSGSSVVSSSSESTGSKETSVVVSLEESSSVSTTYTVASSSGSTTLSPSYTPSVASTSMPVDSPIIAGSGSSAADTPVITPSSTALSTINSSASYSTSTGGSGPLATTIVLPVDVHFDISLSAWVRPQDSIFYWVSSPNVSSLVANVGSGAWVHLDPVNAQYFQGFTLPILAGTEWYLHVTVEHPDNSASMFDIKIIIQDRVEIDPISTSSYIVSSPTSSVGVRSTGRCRSHGASPSPSTVGAATFASSIYGTTSLVNTAQTAAAAIDTTNGAVHGLHLEVTSSSPEAAIPTTIATDETPIDTVRSLIPGDIFDIPLAQYLQNASADEVSSYAVARSVAGYNSDWIIYDASHTTLYGIVPDGSPNVTLLVTVAVVSQSDNSTYFLSVKLIVTEQRSLLSALLPPAPTTVSSSTLSSSGSSSSLASSFSSALRSTSEILSSSASFLTASSSFAGWNFSATSISQAILPTPFYTIPSNDTWSTWPSSDGAANNTMTKAMPSLTITLWATTTAYYLPCQSCSLEPTVVSVATGTTQIPVEVFESYMPDNHYNATVTRSATETESSNTTATTTSSIDKVVVATLTRMTTVTTVAPHQGSGSMGSSRDVTVVTSTVSGDFVSGRKNAADVVGYSLWMLVAMPLIVVLGVDLVF